MSEQTIIEQCSPTLAGLKTANLFPCRYDNKEILWKEIRRFNNSLSHKGIRMLPIRVENHTALIYLYRPKKLEIDMSNEMATKILQEHGYSCKNATHCVAELARKFQISSQFPHEIGLFLGYPPEDVKGFIEHKNEGCKMVGFWKVYGDEKMAQKCFANYKKCTRIYKEQFSKGKSIEHLTVKV